MTKKTDKVSYSIAVTAVGGGVGQSVLRALRLSSLPLRIIGFDVNPWSAGHYTCSKGFTIPHSSSPYFVERLLKKLLQENVKVLIPGTDPELMVIAKERERFLSAGIFPVAGSPEAVALCRDKLAEHRFFNDYGIPYARTASASEALAFATEVGSPIVVKPVNGSGSRGVTVAFNNKQLELQWDLMRLRRCRAGYCSMSHLTKLKSVSKCVTIWFAADTLRKL